MKLLKGIAALIHTAGKQLSSHENIWKYEADKREIMFTNKVTAQLKELGLTESRALDVYYNGYSRGERRMAKKYNGYEMGLIYMIASDTGKIVITYVWKRERR